MRRDVELGFTPGFVAAHPALIDHLAAEALRDLVSEGRARPSRADRDDGRRRAAASSSRPSTSSPDSPRSPTPTLVIAGSEDVVLPPGNSQELAGRIPGARLVTLTPATP